LPVRLPLESLLHRGRKRDVQRQPPIAKRFPRSRDPRRDLEPGGCDGRLFAFRDPWRRDLRVHNDLLSGGLLRRHGLRDRGGARQPCDDPHPSDWTSIRPDRLTIEHVYGSIRRFPWIGIGRTKPVQLFLATRRQSTMTGDRVSHVYSSEGVYRGNLTIDDGSGQVALASKDLTVARSTPGVLTEAATGVEDVRATLHGDLRNLGEATTVIVGFLYGLDPTLSGATNWTSGPASRAGVYASLVTGLTPNTTYYFDAWATGHGFTTGGIMSFTTMASSMPSGTPGATVRVEGTLGTNGWYVSDVTVTLTASDSLPFVAWIHYVVDEGGWLNYTAPLTLHDGKHTLSYYAFDASSSPPERNQYLNVSVDTTPPVVSLEDPSPVVTSSFPVHWTGSDAGSGIAGYEIQVDGGAFQTVGIATSVTLDLADGVHTFTVRATDVAGNKETQTRSV